MGIHYLDRITQSAFKREMVHVKLSALCHTQSKRRAMVPMMLLGVGRFSLLLEAFPGASASWEGHRDDDDDGSLENLNEWD